VAKTDQILFRQVAKSHVLWLIMLRWFKTASPILSLLRTTVWQRPRLNCCLQMWLY